MASQLCRWYIKTSFPQTWYSICARRREPLDTAILEPQLTNVAALSPGFSLLALSCGAWLLAWKTVKHLASAHSEARGSQLRLAAWQGVGGSVPEGG